MNFTIKANTSDVIIGGHTFTTVEENLAEISCLQSENYSTLMTSVLDGVLIILKKGIPVNNATAVMSRLITKHNEEGNDDGLLNEDYLEHKRFIRASFDEDTKAIDELYSKRIADGQAYYRQKRAQTVKKINDVGDPLTSEDAFVIDIKIKDVKDSILTGDWKTAKAHLDLTNVEGAYTQDVKNEYDVEILAYIAQNY